MRESTIAVEGALMVSKWLASQVLLDTDEMAELLKAVGESSCYQIDRVVGAEEGVLSHEQFLHVYDTYVHCLKRGEAPDEAQYRSSFQAALSSTVDTFYQVRLADGRRIIKAIKPVVMIQPHKMHYSQVDGKFRSMVLTKEGFSWGVQFSYPQIYQHPKTMALEKIVDSPAFPNTALFNRLKQWVRHHTLPTPFMMQGKKVMSPVRLGKQAFAWIGRHPQLAALGISVDWGRG